MKIFKLKNKLPLMLSTSLLAGSSAFPPLVCANENANKEKPQHNNVRKEISCVPGKDGNWVCKSEEYDVSPVFDAKQPPLPVLQYKKEYPVAERTSSGTETDHEKATVVSTMQSVKKFSELNNIKTMSNKPLDWVALDKLPNSFKCDQRTRLCQGNYLEPKWPGRDFKGDSNEAPVVARADKYSYKTKGEGILTGRVHIEQGNRLIESDKAFFDKEKNIATLTGNISLRQPGVLVTGSKGKMDTEKNTVQIEDAQYVLQKQHIRGSASEAIRDENQVIHLKNALYTSAPPKSNTWSLKARELTIDPDTGRGVAKYASLNIVDVPVLFTPYLDFPIDKRRKTGLLYPEISMSNKTGVEYTQPFYINIAPNYDDTIILRAMNDRGIMSSNQFRYLQPHFNGEVGGSYLLNPDGFRRENPFFHRHRWFLFWNHHQQLTKDLDTEINYNRASDKSFLKDFGMNSWGTTDASAGQINQDLLLHYKKNNNGNNLSLVTRLQQFQNMGLEKSDPYNRLPQITLDGNRHLISNLSVEYLLDYTRFDRSHDWMFKDKDEQDASKKIYKYNYGPGSGLNNAVGDRFYAKGQLKYKVDRSYGFWEAATIYRSTTYRLNNLNLTEVRNQLKKPSLGKNRMNRPDTFAPTFFTGTGLFLDRPFSINQESYTQTLEPHIQYVYTPHVKNQENNPVFDTSESFFSYDNLYSTDRFSGYDRIGDTNHIALGTTTRILDEKGSEKFLFGIGQIFYLKKRIASIDPTQIENNENRYSDKQQAKSRTAERYQSSLSPVATKMGWHINSKWLATQNYVYNIKRNRIEQYAIELNGRFKYNSVFNIGYQYLSQPDRFASSSDGKVTNHKKNGDVGATQTSFALPLGLHTQKNDSLKLLGAWSYDITNKRNLSRMIGVQKDTCNYRVSVVYRSYFNPTECVETARLKHGVFLQFMLKGLGNLAGNQMSTILQSIKGYNQDNE